MGVGGGGSALHSGLTHFLIWSQEEQAASWRHAAVCRRVRTVGGRVGDIESENKECVLFLFCPSFVILLFADFCDNMWSHQACVCFEPRRRGPALGSVG